MKIVNGKKLRPAKDAPILQSIFSALRTPRFALFIPAIIIALAVLLSGSSFGQTANSPAAPAAANQPAPAPTANQPAPPVPAESKPAAAASDNKPAAAVTNSADVVPSDTPTKETFYKGDAPPGTGDHSISVWSGVAKMIVSLIIVVFLIYLTVQMLKRFYGRGMRLDLKGHHIHVLDVVQLGLNRTVYLVKVGEKTVLLGSGEKGISYLADVTDSIDLEAPEEEETGAPGTAGFNFRKQLNEALGLRKKPPPQNGAAPFTSRLKEKLDKIDEQEKTDV